jgi:hypothetical protein
MNGGHRIQRSILSFLSISLACLLVLSLSMHAVQVKHVHPGHPHSSQERGIAGYGEYFHGFEKKLFMTLLLSFLLAGAAASPFSAVFADFLTQCRQRMRAFLLVTSSLRPRLFDMHLLLFARGILNPQTH